VGRHWDLVASYGIERAWWLERLRDLYTDFRAGSARSGKALGRDAPYTPLLTSRRGLS
jgi:hypothetical protein